MFLELKVIEPAEPSRRALAGAGQVIQVGRLLAGNQLAIPDPFLAPVHFALSFDGTTVQLHDLNRTPQLHPICLKECFTAELRRTRCTGGCRLHDRSGQAGVYVNGSKATDGPLKDGDVLVAGSTGFTVSLSESPLPLAPPKIETPALTPSGQAQALAHIAQQRLPLYALLDAARDPEVLATLRSSGEVYYSLYDGAEGESLDPVAPYLVQLHAQSPLTHTLVREHWGKSWGVFLWALADFKAVRRQLRRFLMVQDAKGKDMYFRFYDPRVLRVFLPTCTPAEVADFYGPINAFLIESDKPARAWVCMNDSGQPLRIGELSFEGA
jgi:pSer/pThr/pTyr-binding forkhead associated (FHA) protein